MKNAEDTVIIPKKKHENHFYISKTLVTRLFVALFTVLGWLSWETYQTRIIVAETSIEVKNLKYSVRERQLRGESLSSESEKRLNIIERELALLKSTKK